MEISERQLRQMASDVDDQHHEGLSTMKSDISELHAETRAYRGDTRRSLLARAGAGAGAGAGLVAIGGSAFSLLSLMPAAAQEEEKLSEEEIAAFAESIELAAVEAYKAAAASGKLEPAMVEIGTMFAGHHAEHASAFGSAAGKKAMGRANPKLLEAVGGQLSAAKNEKAILTIAFDLENAAVATYMFALGVLESPAALALTASILPVESQHAVLLGSALAKTTDDYLPSFETSDKAVDPVKFPAA